MEILFADGYFGAIVAILQNGSEPEISYHLLEVLRISSIAISMLSALDCVMNYRSRLSASILHRCQLNNNKK